MKYQVQYRYIRILFFFFFGFFFWLFSPAILKGFLALLHPSQSPPPAPPPRGRTRTPPISPHLPKYYHRHHHHSSSTSSTRGVRSRFRGAVPFPVTSTAVVDDGAGVVGGKALMSRLAPLVVEGLFEEDFFDFFFLIFVFFFPGRY